jgi:uncharacterized protein (DUF1499 family)
VETSKRALPAVVRIINKTPRAKVTRQEPDYLHAEYTSRIFRFVDDLELRVDDRASLLHVRSASRVGNGDLGVNRQRIEELRSALIAAGVVRS